MLNVHAESLISISLGLEVGFWYFWGFFCCRGNCECGCRLWCCPSFGEASSSAIPWESRRWWADAVWAWGRERKCFYAWPSSHKSQYKSYLFSWELSTTEKTIFAIRADDFFELLCTIHTLAYTGACLYNRSYFLLLTTWTCLHSWSYVFSLNAFHVNWYFNFICILHHACTIWSTCALSCHFPTNFCFSIGTSSLSCKALHWFII